jgi:hypothetical protein
MIANCSEAKTTIAMQVHFDRFCIQQGTDTREIEQRQRNSDEAFETIFRIRKYFHRSMQNTYFYLSLSGIRTPAACNAGGHSSSATQAGTQQRAIAIRNLYIMDLFFQTS